MLDVAERLGVRGEVWNRREGAVEANAYHESQALLDEFVEVLSDGPGRVRDVCATPLSGYEPAAFTVGRTR
jgi:acylphosphatase